MGREKQREHDTKGICCHIVFGTLHTSDGRKGQVPRFYYQKKKMMKSGENLMHIPKCKAKKAFKSPAQPPMGLNLRVPQKPNDSIL